MGRTSKTKKPMRKVLVTLFDDEPDLLKKYQDRELIRDAAPAVRKLMVERLRQIFEPQESTR